MSSIKRCRGVGFAFGPGAHFANRPIANRDEIGGFGGHVPHDERRRLG